MFHWIQWQVCIPVGCGPPACCPYLPACTVPGGRGSAPGGCLLQGVCSWGGVCSQGCLLLGGLLLGGVSQHAMQQTPSPREQNSWHTLLKILPCPNFFAGGKNIGHCNKRARTCHLLCKSPGCYHSASKTRVRDRIFKMRQIHASVIYQIPWIQ